MKVRHTEKDFENEDNLKIFQELMADWDCAEFLEDWECSTEITIY